MSAEDYELPASSKRGVAFIDFERITRRKLKKKVKKRRKNE